MVDPIARRLEEGEKGGQSREDWGKCKSIEAHRQARAKKHGNWAIEKLRMICIRPAPMLSARYGAGRRLAGQGKGPGGVRYFHSLRFGAVWRRDRRKLGNKIRIIWVLTASDRWPGDVPVTQGLSGRTANRVDFIEIILRPCECRRSACIFYLCLGHLLCRHVR